MDSVYNYGEKSVIKIVVKKSNFLKEILKQNSI